MGSFLPDTALTSLGTNNKIYTYAQTESGSLLELEGNLERIDAPVDTYSYDRSTRVVRRYQNDRITNNAPKLFTPLAAADFTPNKSAQKDTRVGILASLYTAHNAKQEAVSVLCR